MTINLTDIIVAVIVAVPPTLVGLLGLRAIKSVHIDINSRMSDLLKTAKGEARAEGKEEGRAETQTK